MKNLRNFWDSAVNHGVGRAKQFYRQSGGDFEKYLELRRGFYENRVKEKSDQQKYYNGWIGRIERIKKTKGDSIFSN